MLNSETQKTSSGTCKIPKDSPDIKINQLSINNFIPEQEIQTNKKIKSFQIKNNDKSNQKNNYSKYEKRVNRCENDINIKTKKNVKFIDKVTKNQLVEIINIESFKQYNKMEEISFSNNHHNCCIII